MKKNNIKINHDYFSLNTRWERIKNFIVQGNVVTHLMDRIIWYYFPKHFITPRFPTHIDIEASSACQMRCPMCKSTIMVENEVKFYGNMDFELYKKVIGDCVGQPLFSIKLSWRGEPLLNPRIVDMVAYAKEKGIRDVAFLTNGERLSPKMSEDLIRAGLDWISVSFDGMGETYDQIRKPAKFEETVQKIKEFRAIRDRLKRKKPLIRVQSVHSAIRGKEQEFLNLWKGVADRVNFIADQVRSIDRKDYRHDTTYICPTPWQRLVIAWDGKVDQCYSDYMEGNILGHVKDKSIKEIWLGEPFEKLRELMKNRKRLATKPCQTCSDGGITEEEEVSVGDRTIKVAHYVHQGVDVPKLAEEKKMLKMKKAAEKTVHV